MNTPKLPPRAIRIIPSLFRFPKLSATPSTGNILVLLRPRVPCTTYKVIRHSPFLAGLSEIQFPETADRTAGPLAVLSINMRTRRICAIPSSGNVAEALCHGRSVVSEGVSLVECVIGLRCVVWCVVDTLRALCVSEWHPR
jgi:hypothetical protein